MSDYGLTPKGPKIKRLDTILEEMHTDLSEKLGVNTRQNTQSLLNVLITNFADRIAELWEFGEHVYHSQYPSSAEGTSLDNATQFGGITRETASKSYYPIHCTGTDGTLLVKGTQIATNTNPKTYLSIAEEKPITRSSFNKVKIRIAYAEVGNTYTAIIDGTAFSFVAQNELPLDILNGLSNAITDTDFEKTINEDENLLILTSKDISINHNLVLSENMTTETVTSVITFGTDELGNILIPNGAITEIVQADAGLLYVENLCEYIAGRNAETDVELRKSYIDKIFNRSSMMLESIKSSILNNVQGVKSVSAYENTTNYANMTILCTGDENEGYWYFFKYDDLYFLFKMPEVHAGDKFIFASSHKTLSLQQNGATSTIDLIVSYRAPSELTYICSGTETLGSLYYFEREHIYYLFSMPQTIQGDKFVFDESNKIMKHVSGDESVPIMLDAGFEIPFNLVYEVTGTELSDIIFFVHKGICFTLTSVSDLSAGDVLTFDTESNTITKTHESDVTVLSPIIRENTPNNFKYEFTGEETSGELSYIIQDGLYYCFKFPVLSTGDFIVFDPDKKELTAVRTGLSTTIDIRTYNSQPKVLRYECDYDGIKGTVCYFSFKDYKTRYCKFKVPTDESIVFNIYFYPESGQMLYGNDGNRKNLECSILNYMPDSGTDVTSEIIVESYGLDISDRLSIIDKGFDITNNMERRPTIFRNLTDKFAEVQIEATDLTDNIVSGMPPHSIEIVVEGGDSYEIAKQILDNKAGGITTYGSKSIPITTPYGDEVIINFNRPSKVYVWIRLSLTLSSSEMLPDNYVDILKNKVIEKLGLLNSGDDVIPQRFVSDLYNVCSGISYIDISLYGANSEISSPPDYPLRVIEISERQIAYTNASMIEVVIPNG